MNRAIGLILGSLMAVSSLSWGADQCRVVFQKDSLSTISAQAKALYWNTELSYILENVPEFRRSIRQRWEEQSKKDPENPYEFAFDVETVFARQLFRQTLESLIGRYAYLDDLTKQFGAKYVLRYTEFAPRAYVERDFLVDVLKTLDQMEKDGVTYKKWNDFTFFYGTATSISRFRETTPWSFEKRVWDFLRLRWDRLTLKMPLNTAVKEYENFKAWRLPTMGKRILNEYLYPETGPDLIEVPVVGALSRDTLLWLMHQGVAPYGVSGYGLMAADGYERPPHNWRIHDATHDWRIYIFKQLYAKENNLSDKKLEAIMKASLQWVEKYIVDTNNIQDPNLKEAVQWYGFRMTHDEGLPLVPSSFADKPKFPILYEISHEDEGGFLQKIKISPVKKMVFEYYYLWFLSRGTQQPNLGVPPEHWSSIYKMHDAAATWLSNFWKGFEDEEQAIINTP